jgi:hypothetical protein
MNDMYHMFDYIIDINTGESSIDGHILYIMSLNVYKEYKDRCRQLGEWEGYPHHHGRYPEYKYNNVIALLNIIINDGIIPNIHSSGILIPINNSLIQNLIKEKY